MPRKKATVTKTMKTPAKENMTALAAHIKELLEMGLNNSQIGRLVGRHPSTIGDYRDRLGIEINKHDKATTLKVLELHRQGFTRTSIQSQLHISRQRVSQILLKHESELAAALEHLETEQLAPN
jgi:DNA-binding NarL/FixJ family response regulator